MTPSQHKTDATPTPWMVEGATVYALHGEPPRNRFSAHVQSGRRDDADEAERNANAALIVRAVNSHEALLAANRKALGVLTGEDMNKQALIDALSMLRAAIALATKETTRS